MVTSILLGVMVFIVIALGVMWDSERCRRQRIESEYNQTIEEFEKLERSIDFWKDLSEQLEERLQDSNETEVDLMELVDGKDAILAEIRKRIA